MNELTDVQLRGWINAGKPISGKSDGGGLTFTLSKNGVAAWVLRYRFGGRQREISIGRYPDIGLATAREKASKLRGKVQLGNDVAAVKRRDKIALASAKTLNDLAEDYMIRVAPELAATTSKETRRFLDKDILPRIGRLRISEITATEIVHLIETVAKRSPSVARRAFEILSVIFAHGVAKHLAKENPCMHLKPKSIIGVRQKRRERIKLSADELRALLAGLPQIGQENALAVKILLAVCVRKGELIRARWVQVDLERGLWTVPDEHSKSGKGFVVPLAPTVARWFSALRELAGNSEYVLPSRARRYDGNTPTISRSTLNAALERLEVDVRRFSPHDLRSTARSHLAALGVDIIVAERCLNHSLGGLVAVYDQHDYLEERKQALEQWADFIERLEQPQKWNVVPLKQEVAA
ncbi:MAG: tyrosine-type recombinase/integrase [Sulfuricaulis sp.]